MTSTSYISKVSGDNIRIGATLMSSKWQYRGTADDRVVMHLSRRTAELGKLLCTYQHCWRVLLGTCMKLTV